MINTGDLRQLVPHAGNMCLLDAVVRADENSIVCSANSHRSPDNPLRYQGMLSVQAGIEYAAQVVAVHGGLLARQAGIVGEPRGGMIAVLSGVSWSVDRLDDIEQDLEIVTEKLVDSPMGVCYGFSVNANKKMLISGELVVALQAHSGMA